MNAFLPSDAPVAEPQCGGLFGGQEPVILPGDGVAEKAAPPADTRTDAQRTALIRLVKALRLVFPGVKQVLGHRDTSPDLNGDGVISPNEYMKACPCFDVQKEGF